MERIIKFRFWSGEKMFYSIDEVMECLKQQILFKENPANKLAYDHVGLHGGAFEQFTGLLDKNGKEIYEGDIVIHDNDNCVINFKNGSFGIDVQETPRKRFDRILSSTKWQIIGNIHQNHELL